MKETVCLLLLLSFAFYSITLASEDQNELNVFAAASLTDAMLEIAEEFEKKYNTKVYLNFAGSRTLKIQIERGMPCDVFISADQGNMNDLVKKGFVDQKHLQILLKNSLVIIGQKDDPAAIENMNDFASKISDHLSIGDPETVPAGIYAKEALRNAGIWDRLKDKIVPAWDVRAALFYVEEGHAQFGIVYQTDTLISEKVRILYEIPQEFYSIIQYPVCILKETTHHKTAEIFFAFLRTDIAQQIFRKYGFILG